MTILSLVLGVLGGICAVFGILTALEVLPEVITGFIGGSGLIGATGTTTAFFWGLAVILLLGCIAAGVNRSRS